MEKKYHLSGISKIQHQNKTCNCAFPDFYYTINRNQRLFFSYFFSGTSGKTFRFHFPDPVHDQSEYGK